MALTIRDIARKAGVSVPTVSKVLNNRPDVSESTRRRVQQVIASLQYNPSGIARSLVLQKTHTLGLIIPDISSPFYPDVAKGVQNRAYELDYSVLLFDSDNKLEKENHAIKLMKSKRVDGMIVSLAAENRQELRLLEEEGFPVMQIDRIVPGSTAPFVTIDNCLSAYEATTYLIGLGHKCIAHITGNLASQTARDRLQGFYKALEEQGSVVTEYHVLQGDYTVRSGREHMRTLLTLKKRPTAVFVANDLMALGCYEAVFERGLSIPGDMSIIGHDDVEIASLIRPLLTTMAQPTYELGRAAVEGLIRQIEGRNANSGKTEVENVVLRAQLIIRSSTCAVG